MKIVIIEDEQLTAEDLAETIKIADPTASVIAILYSVGESISWLQKNKHPDLIFSDIQLGDGLSFEIFKQVQCLTPIIFCTAYDEYAISAFKTNGIDYILKPFDHVSVASALNKYMQLKSGFNSNSLSNEKILALFDSIKIPLKSAILVYQKDKIFPIRLDDIALFYIELEISHLVTFDMKRYSINNSLDELTKIAGESFFRVNRQFIINRKAIKEVSQFFARKLSIVLTIPFKETIIVNKVKATEFLNWLSIR